jgi:phosphoglucosamine mutase
MLYLNALSLRRKGQLRQNGVVMTVMSNFGLRRALKEQGIFYNVVPVGDRNVQAELKKGGYSLGGEQSGHIIFFDDLNTGDGLLSSIKLLNLFAGEKDIYEKINGLAVYPQILENVPFESRERLEKTAVSDGLRAFAEKEEAKFGGNGRILVRMSGTEPLLRVMAEALDENLAKQAVADIIGYIKKEA